MFIFILQKYASYDIMKIKIFLVNKTYAIRSRSNLDPKTDRK